MKGRKRHILVDTEGLLLQVCIHAANIQERAGAKLLLERWRFPSHRLKLIWADAGYWGRKFASWVQVLGASPGCKKTAVCCWMW